jgi:hypothetical protein
VYNVFEGIAVHVMVGIENPETVSVCVQPLRTRIESGALGFGIDEIE